MTQSYIPKTKTETYTHTLVILLHFKSGEQKEWE